MTSPTQSNEDGRKNTRKTQALKKDVILGFIKKVERVTNNRLSRVLQHAMSGHQLEQSPYCAIPPLLLP